ncbi:MAG: response regulator [Rubrivivax sp.]|nr:response regulator [Rubrivivax sp.]
MNSGGRKTALRHAPKRGKLHEDMPADLGDLMDLLAHELHQPLAAILANAQAALRLMERDAPDLEEIRRILDDVVADDRRAAEMIHRLRSAFRRSSAEHKPLQLNDLVAETVPIVKSHPLAGNTAMDLDLAHPLALIEGDRGALQQVLYSLMVNALEAINASGRPGKLTLRTRQAGSDVVLEVEDTGTGVPRDMLDRIFNPFVTARRDALGLGLPLSRLTLARHNGRIWVENNVHGGATFHVAFPAASSPGPVPASRGHRTPREEAGTPHGLTILIADDGKTFRRAIASMLAELPGLELLAEAADGAEAVEKAAGLNPDLVLLDVGLPVVDGVEAAARIRTLVPNAKLVFLTQHESPDFVLAAKRAGAAGYVLKVDAGSELLPAVKAVLRGEHYLSSTIRRKSPLSKLAHNKERTH